MKNVMIVDDETLVRIGMQSIIDWEREGYRLLGVYADGREALAGMAETPPDIVLTDIRMPGMDGFELMEAARKKYPHVHFIILSSFEDFEYTRRAIRAGVKDYVLKHQMEPEELLRILGGIEVAEKPPHEVDPLAMEKEEWLEERGRGGREPDDDPYPLLRHALASRGGDAMRWLCVRPVAGAPRGDEPSGRRAALALAAETLRRWKQAEPLGASGEVYHCAYVYQAGEEERLAEDLARLFRELERNLTGKLNARPAVGVSGEISPGAAERERRAAAEQACRMTELSFYAGSGCFVHGRSPEITTFREPVRLQLYKKAKELILTAPSGEFASWFRQFAADCGALNAADCGALNASEERNGDAGAPNGRAVRNGIAGPGTVPGREEWFDFSDMLHTLLMDRLMEHAAAPPTREEADERPLQRLKAAHALVKQAASFADYESRLLGMVREAETAIGEAAEREPVWVKEIEAWLEDHCTEALRLEDAARRVNFSVGYFSQRFRQETGYSFTEFVARLRIRKAVELLREDKLSTEEIAHRVGYPNANYFVKVFKRVTGRTLSSFKSH